MSYPKLSPNVRTVPFHIYLCAFIAVNSFLLLLMLPNQQNEPSLQNSLPSTQIHTQTNTAASGYALMSGINVNAYRYEFRLLASPGVETLRPHLQRIAQELSAIRAGTFSVANGQYAMTTNPSLGTITIAVSDSQSCSNSIALACGGPKSLLPRAVKNSGNMTRSGQVWVRTATLARPSALLREVLAHEIGHTLGLTHFSGNYAGSIQVMHERANTLPSYQQGDIAGFRALAGAVPLSALDSAIATSKNSIKVTGWAFDPDQRDAATISIFIDGRQSARVQTSLIRQDVTRIFNLVDAPRGFSVTVSNIAQGKHSVCLQIVNFPSGAPHPAQCASVTL